MAEVLDAIDVDIHGFVSQGFLLGIRNNYLAKAKHGSFEFTEAGINFTKPLGDRLRIGLQLFAHELGPAGDYDVVVDWFYLDYHIADWLGLRAGRIKVPFGLYNEISDIDAARPYALLPGAIYPASNRDFLLAQTGVELYGYFDLRSAGALEYRLYGGTIYAEANVAPGDPTVILDIRFPYLAGGRLLWETPLPGLRAGGSLQLLKYEVDARLDPLQVAAAKMAGLIGADVTGDIEIEVPVELAIASIEYAAYDWLIALEYSRWHTEPTSTLPELVPVAHVTEERMYLSVAYRLAEWLQPGAYYALYFPDTDDRTGREHQQHDLALTLRFDLTEHWLLKLEGHYFNGTALLQPQLNDRTPRNELKRNWALLLAKTTAYF